MPLLREPPRRQQSVAGESRGQTRVHPLGYRGGWVGELESAPLANGAIAQDAAQHIGIDRELGFRLGYRPRQPHREHPLVAPEERLELERGEDTRTCRPGPGAGP